MVLAQTVAGTTGMNFASSGKESTGMFHNLTTYTHGDDEWTQTRQAGWLTERWLVHTSWTFHVQKLS